MPLRCFDPTEQTSVHAFDLAEDQWRVLETRNRRERHLRMPCCAAQVTLRTSRRGTRFFAHKALHACTTAPETEAHLFLKRLTVKVARAHGWEAETEISGSSPTDDPWKADVLAHKWRHRVAVEVQWSAETNEEILRRQARYAASGVRGLWLVRHKGFPVTHALPVARIAGNPQLGFTAAVPTGDEEQVLPLEEFLAAAFSKRLHYGIPLGIKTNISVRVGELYCWSCGACTQILTAIIVAAGPHEFTFSVSDFDQFQDIYEAIRDRLPDGLRLGLVKRRYSKAWGRSYLSNGCSHCDALIGAFYEYEALPDKQILEFGIDMDRRWLELIRKDHPNPAGWGVFARQQVLATFP